MATLTPRPDFDWSTLTWAAPDQPAPDHCSFCGTGIPGDTVPLRFCRRDGAGAVLCDACATDIFEQRSPAPRREPPPDLIDEWTPPATLRKATVLVDDLARALDVLADNIAMPAFIIYDHPQDFPECFVIRLWDLRRGPTNIAMRAATLERARAAIPPGMISLPRSDQDKPSVVEIWF